MLNFKYNATSKFIATFLKNKNYVIFGKPSRTISSTTFYLAPEPGEQIEDQIPKKKSKHLSTSVDDTEQSREIKRSRSCKTLQCSPSEILGLQSKLASIPFKERENLESISDTISKFPVSIILKTKNLVSIPIKDLVDLIEQTNKEYNVTIHVGQVNLIDPNDYQLLQDYSILRSPSLLWKYINDGLLNKEQSFSFRNETKKHQEVFMIHMTELGFRKSTFFLHEYSSKFEKSFETCACILNAPKFPAITLIKRPNSGISNEDKTMADNLYTLASLGLVRVTKMGNGNLKLSHNHS